METIFALASAPGTAGVAVIRISGPEAFAICKALTGRAPKVGEVSLRWLRNAEDAVLDQALVLSFAASASFTGENIVEFQTHGSRAVVDAVLREIEATGLARPAEAGEFTRRALENDRLDLAQVEGLGALIEAETEAQRVQAMRVFTGYLGQKVDRWRADLLRAAALIEATLDFADEEVPVDVGAEVSALLTGVTAEFTSEIDGSYIAERIRDGFEVAILGRPNAGKSTLLNAMAGREAALTSEIAGTTRDVIEVRMDVRGLAVTFLDTAGLRDPEDTLEKMGIARAKARAEAADLRVYLLSDPDEVPEIELGADDIVLEGKADLIGRNAGAVSGKTGAGVDTLLSQVADLLSDRVAGAGLATHARHRLAMIAAMEALALARIEVEAGAERGDLAAEHLRTALRSLDALIGRVDVEAVLGEIFSSFCIGK